MRDVCQLLGWLTMSSEERASVMNLELLARRSDIEAEKCLNEVYESETEIMKHEIMRKGLEQRRRWG